MFPHAGRGLSNVMSRFPTQSCSACVAAGQEGPPSVPKDRPRPWVDDLPAEKGRVAAAMRRPRNDLAGAPAQRARSPIEEA